MARKAETAQAKRVALKCAECGALFVPEYPSRRSVYCSDNCVRAHHARDTSGSNHRRRARRFRVAYEPVDRMEVFDRDAWRCQVCGRKTLLGRIGTAHPRAPELGHRVPVSRGGAHTYENTQCERRRCNASKSNKSEAGQLPLWVRPAAGGAPRAGSASPESESRIRRRVSAHPSRKCLIPGGLHSLERTSSRTGAPALLGQTRSIKIGGL